MSCGYYQLLNAYKLTEYVDELTAKAIQYCMKDDDDKPTLQPHKPSLASTYIHPNKDHIPLFSRNENRCVHIMYTVAI